ncbi:MAG: ribonuclease HI family protein [Bacillota bacterium]|nr:ribonuclease HI family protein [Bacillota bacterium]
MWADCCLRRGSWRGGTGVRELGGRSNAGEAWTVYIDGGARGNPGPAAAAGVITDGSRNQRQFCVYLGVTTNNVAEYLALVWVLEEARRAKVAEMTVFTDSELLARQVTGAYRVRSPRLVDLHGQAERLIRGLRRFEIRHVRREENRAADSLVNRTLDWVGRYAALQSARADEGSVRADEGSGP